MSSAWTGIIIYISVIPKHQIYCMHTGGKSCYIRLKTSGQELVSIIKFGIVFGIIFFLYFCLTNHRPETQNNMALVARVHTALDIQMWTSFRIPLEFFLTF